MNNDNSQSLDKNNISRSLCLAVLAHVDAGKTTLSEAMLCLSGVIRSMGRVDNGDAFLDYNEVERARGITVFSKQAVFVLGSRTVTLLDTPGHVDLSAETERALFAADCAVLLISGPEGVQSHTETLWELLRHYDIPCFIFVNKMDREGADRSAIMRQLMERLDGACVDIDSPGAFEDVAACDEDVLESYLSTGTVTPARISRLISERKLFPVYFGSALKAAGVPEFMEGLEKYAPCPVYPKEFGARVIKITRDEQGNRLTHMKLTGGCLHVRDVLPGTKDEKVNQIRLYSGEKYETLKDAEAGYVVAVTGPADTYPGEGLGYEKDADPPLLEPVLRYRLILPPGTDARGMLNDLRQLAEEMPELSVSWEEESSEIQIKVMGAVQLEILKGMIEDRFGVTVDFGAGHIVYKEEMDEDGLRLLEPVYHFRLRIPTQNVGKALSDLGMRSAVFAVTQTDGTFSVITGSGPVATLWDYPAEVSSYTGGRGSFTTSFGGYERCHNEKELLKKRADEYGGIPWESGSGEDVSSDEREYGLSENNRGGSGRTETEEEELKKIFARTYGEPKARTEERTEVRYDSDKAGAVRPDAVKSLGKPGYLRKKPEETEEYLLVDGYNIIHAWKDLDELSGVSLDAARQRLMDILSNYQGYRSGTLILVFDAYKVPGNPGSVVPYHNIYVVYTKEAEIADAYIEKLAHRMGRRYRVTVATSDGLEQLIIRGQGCYLMTADDLRQDVCRVEKLIEQEGEKLHPSGGSGFFSGVDEDTLKTLRDIGKDDG